MENIKELITIASACLGFIATLTGFLIPLVKNVKAKNKLKSLNKLSVALQAFVVEAEQRVNFTGEEKKQFVLTKANRYALDNKIPFNEQSVDGEIESLVALSKSVNKRGALPAAENVSVNEQTLNY
ncbi:MAG: phage holin, LLH family [Clostridia bacterium]|nr:phage holin, LLH family [Clostridia bacterium]